MISFTPNDHFCPFETSTTPNQTHTGSNEQKHTKSHSITLFSFSDNMASTTLFNVSYSSANYFQTRPNERRLPNYRIATPIHLKPDTHCFEQTQLANNDFSCEYRCLNDDGASRLCGSGCCSGHSASVCQTQRRFAKYL